MYDIFLRIVRKPYQVYFIFHKISCQVDFGEEAALVGCLVPDATERGVQAASHSCGPGYILVGS